jgi:hypothetical protein
VRFDARWSGTSSLSADQRAFDELAQTARPTTEHDAGDVEDAEADIARLNKDDGV